MSVSICKVCGKSFESKCGSSYCSRKFYRKEYDKKNHASVRRENKLIAAARAKEKLHDPRAWIDVFNENIRQNDGKYKSV